jgi:hypothetical protein
MNIHKIHDRLQDNAQTTRQCPDKNTKIKQKTQKSNNQRKQNKQTHQT